MPHHRFAASAALVMGTFFASTAQASPITLTNLTVVATAGTSLLSPVARNGGLSHDFDSASLNSNESAWAPAPSSLSLTQAPLPHSHIAPALGIVWREPAAVDAVGFLVTPPTPASLADRPLPARVGAAGPRGFRLLATGTSPTGTSAPGTSATGTSSFSAVAQNVASPVLPRLPVLIATLRPEPAATPGPSQDAFHPTVPAVATVQPVGLGSQTTSQAPSRTEPAAASVPPAGPSQADLVQLAKLDQDLAAQENQLDQTAGHLTESQRQLQQFTDVLHQAVLAAGPDARGLHPFVKVAENYIGTPYVWGGVSARGFDCSGFVIRVMRDLGYHALPHSAAEQFHYGIPVDEKDLKPGDLVFFANTYKPGVSHVGIYLGHRKFINAANSSVGTIVSSLDEPKWRAKYAGARRLLPIKA